MAKWSIMVVSALLGCAYAEPPSGYSYSAPSTSVVLLGSSGHGFSSGGGGYSSGGGGYSSGGGGYSSGGGSYSSGLSSGGHYSRVPVGHQESEGYHVDPHLLDKIKHIILKDEIQNQAYQSSYQSHGSGHGVSSHYGAPAPVYGVPHHHERIVGIELDHIQQGIQVAQYHQGDDHYSGGGGYAGGYSGYSSGGYSSGGHGGFSSGHGSISQSYSAPSISYATIGVPSGSYGIPSPSSSYGSPHH